ncbi:MAG: putative rane protein, partial [Pseudomonadota bacterium]
MLDLFLAAGHHLTIFALFGVLTAELVMLRPGMDAVALRRIAAVDL